MMRLMDCLERSEIAGCATGGVAVHHRPGGPMVTWNADFAVTTDAVQRSRMKTVAIGLILMPALLRLNPVHAQSPSFPAAEELSGRRAGDLV